MEYKPEEYYLVGEIANMVSLPEEEILKCIRDGKIKATQPYSSEYHISKEEFDLFRREIK